MTSLIRIDNAVPIEVRDGTILRADIYRPGDNAKYPVLLMRTPYHRQFAVEMSFLPILDTVKAGYSSYIDLPVIESPGYLLNQQV